MADIYDDEDGFGRDTRRDWANPRDPRGLLALLGSFAELVNAMPAGPVMAAQSPAWFDDVAHCTREVVSVGGASVESTAGWFGFQNWPDANGVLPSPQEQDSRRAREIERNLEGVDPALAEHMRALIASVHDGALQRSLVEGAVHPLESEEIMTFSRPQGGCVMLSVSHTNGWTDMAYALMADGRLLCWPALETADRVKDDDGVPTLPDLDTAVEIALTA